MANEIRKTGVAPYVENTDAELDSVQYAVLLHTTRNNSLLSDLKYATDATGAKGPKLIAGAETDALAAAIFGDIKDAGTYPDVDRVKTQLIGGTITESLYNHALFGAPNWQPTPPPICGFVPTHANCTPSTQTVTVDPVELAGDVQIPSSVDISGISIAPAAETGSADTTTVFDSTDAAYAAIADLVNTPANLDGQLMNVHVTHAIAQPNPNVPAGSSLDGSLDGEIIPAINQLSIRAGQADDRANVTQNELWNTAVGQWNSSQTITNSDGTANTFFDYDISDTIKKINPEWDMTAGRGALLRLNMIPVLNQDKILVNTVVTDPNTGVSEDVLVIDPDSQVNLLEATWTLWRHITELSTDSYGISALTDNSLSGDRHVYNEALSGNSFIQNFNLLYSTITNGLTAVESCCDTNTKTITALSAKVDDHLHDLPDLTSIYQAISGVGDVLHVDLAGNSIYTNLNNIYTGLSGVQDCCDTNITSITALSAAIDDIPTGNVNLTHITNAISGTGDVLHVNLSGDSIYKNINNLYVDLSGVQDCCDLIKNHIDSDDHTTIITQLSSLVDTNILNINSLSGCCIDNGDEITLLKNIIYGPNHGDTFITDIDDNSIITNINTIYQTLSTMTGNPSITGDNTNIWAAINNNTFNITEIFSNVQNLSGEIVNIDNDITNVETTAFNNYTTNVTRITTLSDSLSNYVDLTTNQTISGEKFFEDDLTVAAPLSAGEDVTIGYGDTVFNVCTGANGDTQVIVNGLLEDGVHDISSLPTNALYIKEINGTKVLAIKTT